MRRDQTLEFYLAYARELKEIYSRFDVLAGYSWQHFFNKTTDYKVANDGSGKEFSTTRSSRRKATSYHSTDV